MRTVSGARNRFLLATTGFVITIFGAFLTLVSLGLTQRIPILEELPSANATVGDVFGVRSQFFMPVLIAAAVIVTLVSLVWLITQIPGKPSPATFWLQQSTQNHVVSMESSVLENAVRQHCETVPDLRRANVQVAGSARHPEIFMGLSLEPGASVTRTLAQVYGTVIRDVSAALETRPTQVCVELDVARSSTTSAKTTAVATTTSTGQRGQLA